MTASSNYSKPLDYILGEEIYSDVSVEGQEGDRRSCDVVVIHISSLNPQRSIENPILVPGIMARLAYSRAWKTDKIRVRGESDIKVGMRVLKSGATMGKTDDMVDFIYHDPQLPVIRNQHQNTRYTPNRTRFIRSIPRGAIPDRLYWIRMVGLSGCFLGVLMGFQRFWPCTKSGVYICFLYYADEFD